MRYPTRDQSTSWHQTLRKVFVPLTAAAVLLLGSAATGQTQPTGYTRDHAVSTDLASSSRDAAPSSRDAAPPSRDAASAGSTKPRAWPPTPSNVGVPAGTTLSRYAGPCTISRKGTVIAKKTINCSPLYIKTTGVVIQSSKINGSVQVGTQDDYDPTVISDPEGDDPIRVTVLDSEIHTSDQNFRPISSSHYVVKRSYLHGSESGAECHNACTIKRSYVHGFGEHASGLRILRNGKLKHNTIWCEPNPDSDEDQDGVPDPDGGCSGNLVMYEEFGTPRNNVVKHNYFPAGLFWYSLKFNGEDDGRIRIVNNVFGKPQAGVADDWEAKPSNVWAGNTYTNGRTARP